MLQKPAQELFEGQSHRTALAVVRVVFPPEGDLIAVHRQEPVIRDGHAMGIAGQVLQHVLRPAKGSLGVDDPFLSKQRAQERCERLPFRRRLTPGQRRRFASSWKARPNPATNFQRKRG